MRVTEVQVKNPEVGEKRVIAYATVILDGELVIHDLRLVEGTYGLFVAMPDKEIWNPCEKCQKKSPHRAKFCMHCGQEKPHGERVTKRFMDVIHPLSPALRAAIQEAVLRAVEQSRA